MLSGDHKGQIKIWDIRKAASFIDCKLNCDSNQPQAAPITCMRMSHADFSWEDNKESEEGRFLCVNSYDNSTLLLRVYTS